MIIVIAWRSTRLTAVPYMTKPTPQAALWERESTSNGLSDAQNYVDRESKTEGTSNWQVYTYPAETGWKRALELAKEQVMK